MVQKTSKQCSRKEISDSHQKTSTLEKHEKDLIVVCDNVLSTCYHIFGRKISNISKVLWSQDNAFRVLRTAATTTGSSDPNFVLERNLADMNLARVEVPRDGNRLFHAVAEGLKLVTEGLKPSLSVQTISDLWSTNQAPLYVRLRAAAVQEISENKDRYKDFCTKEDFRSIKKYLEPGQFSVNTGDLMLLALCNATGVCITVITAHRDFSTVLLNPEKVSSLFVTYDHSGPGQYDAEGQPIPEVADNQNPQTMQKCESVSSTTPQPVLKVKGYRYGCTSKNTSNLSCLGKRCSKTRLSWLIWIKVIQNNHVFGLLLNLNDAPRYDRGTIMPPLPPQVLEDHGCVLIVTLV